MKKRMSLILLVIVFCVAIIFLPSYFLIRPGINSYTKDKSQVIEEINKKYDNLEKEKERENTEKKNEITKSINDKRKEQTDEFRANGFSQKYYDLATEIDVLQEEETKLFFSNFKDMFDDKRAREINKLNSQNVRSMFKIIIGLLIIVIPFLYFIIKFNKLIRLKNFVKSKWSDVDIYLKQRADLIPNILEAVKGYSSHEKDTLNEVVKAREQVINANNKEEKISANETLGSVVNKLFMLSEEYPKLKADNNFMNLQDNLRYIEDNIAHARQKYNYAVLRYKNAKEVFPTNIISNIFNFKDELFFEITEEEKENFKINF